MSTFKNKPSQELFSFLCKDNSFSTLFTPFSKLPVYLLFVQGTFTATCMTNKASVAISVCNEYSNRIWRSIWIFILPRPKNVRVRFLLRLKRVADVWLCFELARSFTRKNQTGCPTLLHRFRMREISKLTTFPNVSRLSILSVKTGKGNSFVPTNSNLWDLPG